MPKTKKKQKFPVVVDRAFLLNLARDIYDSKTRKFMRLCDGKLTNGPDPTNKKRTMHCGLGELYFAMTGKHTTEEPWSVSEEDVIDKAVELSTLHAAAHERRLAASASLQQLDLPQVVIDKLEKQLDDVNDDDFIDQDAEDDFRSTLDDVPSQNDDGYGDDCGEGACTIKTLRKRSQRVAALLRQAARSLPH